MKGRAWRIKGKREKTFHFTMNKGSNVLSHFFSQLCSTPRGELSSFYISHWNSSFCFFPSFVRSFSLSELCSEYAGKFFYEFCIIKVFFSSSSSAYCNKVRREILIDKAAAAWSMNSVSIFIIIAHDIWKCNLMNFSCNI